MKQVGQGLTQKTYSYEPLGALVDIITNTAGKPRYLFRSWEYVNMLCRASRSSHGSEGFWWRNHSPIHAVCVWDADACYATC